MRLFMRLTLCASIPLLASCQTEARLSKNITTATDGAIWKEALCSTGKAILISHDDLLTLETAEQIGDHNNQIFCACPDQRPATFDVSICKV